MKSKAEKIQIHLFGGPLGVGKTTAIRQLLRQSDQYTAVIVNDFGETGYDAALIGESSGEALRVESVPGGCLCCTSAAQLRPALRALCEDPRVERIIVEPSGVALLDPLLNMLNEAAPECGFELRSVIVLFDAQKTRPAALEMIPYWRHLADRADIAVINRCDLAPQVAVDAIYQWLEKLEPPKFRIVKTEFGHLPPEIFELRRTERPFDPHHHHSDLPPAGTFRSSETFRLDGLLDVLREIAPSTERFKGVFQTEQGWMRLEIAGGRLEQTRAEARAESSADWIGDSAEITANLQACRR